MPWFQWAAGGETMWFHLLPQAEDPTTWVKQWRMHPDKKVRRAEESGRSSCDVCPSAVTELG